MPKYLLGYVLKSDQLVEFKSEEDAADRAEDWCSVEASSLDEAKAKYEETFLAWQSQTNSVKKAYEDGECPDCGETIPDDVQEGQTCSNCQHVFYSQSETKGAM